MRINKNKSKYIPSQQEIKDLEQKINSLTKSEKLVANYYFGTANIRKSIFLSQAFVALRLGLCRETVNRALKKLHELGLITKIDRGWKEDRARIKKTCYYIVNKLFFYKEIREKYKSIFLALSYLVIFSNFESIFGINSKPQKEHSKGIITGIKSYPNSLFINSQADTGISRVNCLRRRRLLNTKRLKQDISKLIIEEGRVMSEFKLPKILESADFLNLAGKMQLAVFNEVVISHAFAKMAVAKEPARPMAYVIGICKGETTKRGLTQKDRPTIPMVEGEAEFDMAAFKSTRKSAGVGRSAVQQDFQKKEEKPRIIASAIEVPESTLTDADKIKILHSYKARSVCYKAALERYRLHGNPMEKRWADDYYRLMNDLVVKYPYLFVNEPEPSNLITENKVNTVDIRPDTSEFEQGRPELSESDYEEVLD